MRIGGIRKFSAIDYPGKLSAIIFLQGCNFRCGYCHNPQLVIPEKYSETISEEEIFSFLEGRREHLQGVVVSGGEPTIQKELPHFLRKIKQMGYLIKLDTNGSNPQVLQRLITLELIDYIAMDVKSCFSCYEEAVGVPCLIENIKKSIYIIKTSKIEHEFRTTVVKGLHSESALYEITRALEGADSYRIQKARITQDILNPQLARQEQFTDAQISYLKSQYEWQKKECNNK